MTSLTSAVMYGNERTNVTVITTDLSFGISTFRNLHFLLLWHLLSVYLKLLLSSKSMPCLVCESSCEFPTRRVQSLLPEWVLVALYK